MEIVRGLNLIIEPVPRGEEQEDVATESEEM